jgi:hypothetical protein
MRRCAVFVVVPVVGAAHVADGGAPLSLCRHGLLGVGAHGVVAVGSLVTVVTVRPKHVWRWQRWQRHVGSFSAARGLAGFVV